MLKVRPVAPQIKTRLDQLLVTRNLAPSRSRAQSLIMAGAVKVNGVVVTKSGSQWQPAVQIELNENPNPFVSRGGLKLSAALDAFSINPEGLCALDIGASTGGFTDCLLQRGARRIYAVDVGYGQLAWSLRQHPDVIVLERTNARYLSRKEVPETCELAVFDTSFISLTKIFPAVLPLLAPGATLIALVKPQFEAEPAQVGKGGVIRDPVLRKSIVDSTVTQLTETGVQERDRMDSPVHGPKGNIEALVWFVKSAPGALNESRK